MQLQNNEPWVSLEEVSEYLGVNKDTVRNWIKKTDIPAHKIGRQWKFKLSEVDEWVKVARVPCETVGDAYEERHNSG